MKFRSLETLLQTDTLDALNNIPYFDLSQVCWTTPGGKTVYIYVVDQFEEMRLDLISSKIYGNTDYIDFLMYINDIINPLNIVAGTILFYTNIEDVNGFKVEAPVVEDVRNKLINLSKSKRVDKNREDSNNNAASLPPTVNNGDFNPIQFEGDRVVIGKGIFNT